MSKLKSLYMVYTEGYEEWEMLLFTEKAAAIACCDKLNKKEMLRELESAKESLVRFKKDLERSYEEWRAEKIKHAFRVQPEYYYEREYRSYQKTTQDLIKAMQRAVKTWKERFAQEEWRGRGSWTQWGMVKVPLEKRIWSLRLDVIYPKYKDEAGSDSDAT